MLGFLQATKIKMRIAQFLYYVLRFFGIKSHQIVERQKIKYELDLKEGIDLSIFLFGNFQDHIYKNLAQQFTSEPVVLDVGANIGAISLKLAQIFPQAIIYAFEPTHYAWRKLTRNLALNSTLGKRIHPIQSFVGEQSLKETDFKAFSSWPIDSLKENGTKHKVHLGEEKEATSNQISIDDFVKLENLKKVDLIKIDTDGYELNVLKGAVNTLKNHRPIVVFEFCTYLLKEKGISFNDFYDLFRSLNYSLRDSKGQKNLSIDNIGKISPSRGSIDIFAYPDKLVT